MFAKCGLVFTVVISLALGNVNSARGQNSYNVTDLGSLMPTGINGGGCVCGNIPIAGGAVHAAVYSNGSLQDLVHCHAMVLG
jgi:hypothetical protein